MALDFTVRENSIDNAIETVANYAMDKRVAEHIEALNLDAISPREALDILYELKDWVENGGIVAGDLP